MCIMLFYNLKKGYAEEKNTDKPIAYTCLGSGDELCEEYAERLESVDEKSRDYTELYFLSILPERKYDRLLYLVRKECACKSCKT